MACQQARRASSRIAMRASSPCDPSATPAHLRIIQPAWCLLHIISQISSLTSHLSPLISRSFPLISLSSLSHPSLIPLSSLLSLLPRACFVRHGRAHSIPSHPTSHSSWAPSLSDHSTVASQSESRVAARSPPLPLTPPIGQFAPRLRPSSHAPAASGRTWVPDHARCSCLTDPTYARYLT